jgi:hypothetical protein
VHDRQLCELQKRNPKAQIANSTNAIKVHFAAQSAIDADVCICVLYFASAAAAVTVRLHSEQTKHGGQEPLYPSARIILFIHKIAFRPSAKERK